MYIRKQVFFTGSVDVHVAIIEDLETGVITETIFNGTGLVGNMTLVKGGYLSIKITVLYIRYTNNYVVHSATLKIDLKNDTKSNCKK